MTIPRPPHHDPSVTVLIYDQPARRERRRRSTGMFRPDKHVVINGLWLRRIRRSVQLRAPSARSRPSSAAERTSTSRAATRRLFLPQAVLPIVRDGTRRQLRPAAGRPASMPALPEPSCRRSIGQTYNVMRHPDQRHQHHDRRRPARMAAHLEGKGVGIIDMAGLAREGRAVYSHMRIAERPGHPRIRVAADNTGWSGSRHRRAALRRRYLADRQAQASRRSWSISPFLPQFHPQCRFPARSRTAPARMSHGFDGTATDRSTRLAVALFGQRHGGQHLPRRLRLSASIPLFGRTIEQAITLNGEAVGDRSRGVSRWRRRAANRTPASRR